MVKPYKARKDKCTGANLVEDLNELMADKLNLCEELGDCD